MSPSTDLRSGAVRRQHLNEATIQRAVAGAARRAGLHKPCMFSRRETREVQVACLRSRWRGAPDEADLLSFAAITDEPPPAVATVGNDRCVIPLKREHIDAWLNPNPEKRRDRYALLDDRDRPFYEHRWLGAA